MSHEKNRIKWSKQYMEWKRKNYLLNYIAVSDFYFMKD